MMFFRFRRQVSSPYKNFPKELSIDTKGHRAKCTDRKVLFVSKCFESNSSKKLQLKAEKFHFRCSCVVPKLKIQIQCVRCLGSQLDIVYLGCSSSSQGILSMYLLAKGETLSLVIERGNILGVNLL